MHENDGKWESASPRDRERIDALARAVVNRLLHDPTVRMKEMRDDRVHARMALVRDLFGLTGTRATWARSTLMPPSPQRSPSGSPRCARSRRDRRRRA